MRIPLILLLSACSASMLGQWSRRRLFLSPRGTIPPPITTASRAREVIAAYDNEKRVWRTGTKKKQLSVIATFL